ncbi:molybdopterin-guanine dinucleotide biosynthesis protein B [Picrophilus oshimae DSM 9789]|uniref:Molybdopterin-guanine dinucleotide biosynthesis protein B n=2 Tax=Picrophilus oshimae TaxID=46632 RepID=Q6L188_PICTO|nr:molybdopterin-guanine dinucleotide biosynthesis protein B [Picrophilus oshimae DSM 9789]
MMLFFSMKIYSFFGSSGSGKTTLIYDLISRFSDKYKIVYIKNIHDNISLDFNGKDTWRMESAGAYITYGLTPTRTYRMERKRYDIKNIINDGDIVFIEGFRDYRDSTRFLLLGDAEYKKYGYDFIINTTNREFMDGIKYPEEIDKIIEIIGI